MIYMYIYNIDIYIESSHHIHVTIISMYIHSDIRHQNSIVLSGLRVTCSIHHLTQFFISRDIYAHHISGFVTSVRFWAF